MLRTSLRSRTDVEQKRKETLFLSSNAQDFIEEAAIIYRPQAFSTFLSSNAQDFIEETTTTTKPANTSSFLSSNAQDFIEDFG